MNRTKTISLLLTPSILSAITSIISTALVMVVASWSYINHYELFYNDLFGRYGLVTATITLNAQNPFTVIRSAVLGHILTYNIALIAVAIIAGLAVYVVLEGWGHFIAWAQGLLREVQTADPAHSEAIKQDLGRLTIRIVGIVGWAFYLIFFSNAIVPTSLLALQVGLEGIERGNAEAIYAVVAVLLFLISLHVHVIFVRLCFLRLRLLGGYDVELGADE